MPKAKVQDIFPLNYNQKILLFHHLSNNNDSGIIQVKCTIEGRINQEAFTKAWAAVVEKYDVLRTSIQWKNLSKQLQVVQENAELEIDWINLEIENNPIEILKEYELNDRKKSFSLSKAPVSRITVFQHNQSHYQLLWTCHHILLDGWSSRLILQDVFRYYDLAINSEEFSIDTAPSMIAYLKANQEQSHNSEAKHFWKDQIDENRFPDRISAFHLDNGVQDNFKSIETFIPRKEVLDFAKKNSLTLTSLLQTAWLLTLKWFHQNNLAVTGMVVSGRASDFPDIEKIAGLLSNVLPLIHRFEPEQNFVEAAKNVQQNHAKARKYETISIDQIKEWCQWEGNPNLFDTLLVIENFIQGEIASRHLNIKNYESGLTTTYPITISVVPDETIKLYCVWNERVIDSDLAKKLLYTFKEILTTHREQGVNQISKAIGPPPATDINEESEPRDRRKFVSARTQTELELTKIWESILGLKAIGIADSFFSLGGKSIQALQLFREIEKSFKKTLLPSVLIQHPTIKQLSHLINENEEVEFRCVVPLKTSGHKAPLFCIHAGGAHVFLYRKLAESLGVDYPVYAIQPKGLDGGEMHHSIEEMARDYLKEILTITNQQKFYLLGYCFSTAVCLEIARIAKKHDLEIELVIIDSGALLWYLRQGRLDRIKYQILKFGKKILEGDWQGISKITRKRIEQVNVKFRVNRDNHFEEVVKESENHPDHHLERMNLNLERLYKKYHWDSFQTKVHLIRSSEFADLHEKDYHINVWKNLSNNELTTYQVDGEHDTIFDGNSVVEMARTIEKIIEYEIE